MYSISELDFERHGAAILEIFNHAILHTTAIYEYLPWQPHDIKNWFAQKEGANFPVIGILNESTELMGFASYGRFRERAAYQFTVEHSVYVHPDHQGKGIGKQLLGEVIALAGKNGIHAVIGGIDASNQVSIALHEALGFSHAGTIKEAAYKFDRWLDLAFYQRLLNGPINPGESVPTA